MDSMRYENSQRLDGSGSRRAGTGVSCVMMSLIMAEISGIIRLDRPDDFSDARVIVRLDDVTNVDTAARLCAHTSFLLTAIGVQTIPFRLSVPQSAFAHRCALSVEIHRDGAWELQSGDYRNIEAYPLTGPSSGLIVTVRRIDTFTP